MGVNIQAILDNIRQISLSPSSMEFLREFERVIDENGLYAFLHWKQGELCDGPKVSAYRVKCTFFWPLSKMPDPAGAQRLIPYGVKITYKKAWMKYPVKVHSEDDFRPGVKKPKIAKIPIWLVTIDIPKYLIKDITRGSKEIINREFDMENIQDAYERDLDSIAGNGDIISPTEQNNESGMNFQ